MFPGYCYVSIFYVSRILSFFFLSAKPGHISVITERIIAIQKTRLSSIAIDVHWVGPFAPCLKGPKSPKRPQILSGIYLGD